MKKLITIFCMALVSCGAFGQSKAAAVLDNFLTDSHGTRWKKITHFQQSENGVYVQAKSNKGHLVSRFTPLKQTVPDFWVLTKKDSSNIRSIQALVLFKGESNKVLNDLVFLWYKHYKFEGNTESEIFMHTVQDLSKEIEKLK